MEPTRDLSELNLLHIIDQVNREIYWCDKACGCGQCHLHYLAQFNIDDNGGVLK